MGVSRLRGLMNITKRSQTEAETENMTEIENEDKIEEDMQMPKDPNLDQLDREILKIRDEHNRISEQLAELESKAKSKLSELKALEEKRRWEEEKAKLDTEMREVFTRLLELNWQIIPAFMNDSFAHLRGIAGEYDKLKEEEAELTSQFGKLKKNLAYTDVETAKLQGEIYKTIGERVEIILELKRLLRSLDEKDSLWIQESDSVLRFLDVRREILQLKW
jgi:chromosome segregation ATPase